MRFAFVLILMLMSAPCAAAEAVRPSCNVQEHASMLARIGRLVHSSCGKIEGIAMGQTRESARRNCCYYGTRPILEEAAAYSPSTGRWYAVIRYR
jgi:hypothetical protein